MRRILILLALTAMIAGAAYLLLQRRAAPDAPAIPEKAPAKPPAAVLFPVTHKNRWGFIDASGKVVIQPTFAAASEFKEGFAAVQSGDKWGYINTAGVVVIPPQFEGADAFHEGLARVVYDREISEFSGFIDPSGNLVINKEDADFVGAFSEGLASLQIHGKFGFIDRAGKTVIPNQFDVAADFAGGMAKVGMQEGGAYKWGFIDTTGKIVIPIQYDDAGDFTGGLAAVKAGEKYGFINSSGDFQILPKYDYAGDFAEGLAPVHVAKFGFINASGQMVIPEQFDLAYPFTEGLARVSVDQGSGPLTGFIDTTGRFVIDPHFDNAGAFSGGLAMVQQGGYTGYVDHTGKFVWNPCAACNITDK